MAKKPNLDVDLETGVVPISKAASSLASLIKRSRANRQPIIVTQKGYPTGVILDLETGEALRKLGQQHSAQLREIMQRNSAQPTSNIPEPSAEESVKPKRVRGKKNNPQ